LSACAAPPGAAGVRRLLGLEEGVEASPSSSAASAAARRHLANTLTPLSVETSIDTSTSSLSADLADREDAVAAELGSVFSNATRVDLLLAGTVSAACTAQGLASAACPTQASQAVVIVLAAQKTSGAGASSSSSSSLSPLVLGLAGGLGGLGVIAIAVFLLVRAARGRKRKEDQASAINAESVGAAPRPPIGGVTTKSSVRELFAEVDFQNPMAGRAASPHVLGRKARAAVAKPAPGRSSSMSLLTPNPLGAPRASVAAVFLDAAEYRSSMATALRGQARKANFGPQAV
jgi:hypothetical protein